MPEIEQYYYWLRLYTKTEDGKLIHKDYGNARTTIEWIVAERDRAMDLSRVTGTMISMIVSRDVTVTDIVEEVFLDIQGSVTDGIAKDVKPVDET